MLEYIGFSFIFLGVVIFSISAFGLLRMPDIYTRMHVGTKATTMGILLVVFGSIFIEPTWSLKLILLAIFILITNPLSSSVIARAAHKDGNKLKLDELKESER